MDPLHLIIEASRADQALAAHTTDQDLHTAIARHRPDLWAALAMNPGIHPDLLAWLESQGVVSSPGPARGDADEGAEDGEDDAAQDDAEEAGDAARSGDPEAVGAAESDDADPGDEPDDGGPDVDNDGEDDAAQDDTEDAE
ncbi:hypothetical protein IR146_13790, partial [Actinomyces bowdenii]|nr:hypothetical protein [Actinomyces bowdenii]NYS70558.1 hypothetical protein [Actinomyces bowdenii]